jgi:glycosyltransferase involved in cell wall biosynthesis
MPERPLTVAWISYFPVEWLPDAPEELRALPRMHPATWQRTLLEEFCPARFPGLKLHIISVRRHFPRTFSFARDNAVMHCIKLPRGMRSLSLFWWETMLIRRCLKDVRPDLVHAWGTERGAALVASRLGYPHLVTIQGLLEWYAQQAVGDSYNRLDARLEKPGLRRASIASGESAFVLDWLKKHYPHLETHHVDVVPDQVFHHIERRPEPGPLRLLYLGMFEHRKGADLLVRALNQIETPYRVIAAGHRDARLEQRLRLEAPGKFWNQVEFKQGLGPKGVADELSRATLMLCPTRGDTGPMAVKEAAVAGVPVIGSDIGGIPDYITPGKNGLLFSAGDAEGFLAALREGLAHPLFRVGQVDEATRQQVRGRLSPKLMAERFMAVYQRVLEGSSEAAGLR